MLKAPHENLLEAYKSFLLTHPEWTVMRLKIDVLLGAELVEDGQATEHLANFTIERERVKHGDESAKYRDGRHDGHRALPSRFLDDVFLVLVGEFF